MKKTKLTLGLVGALVATGALSACNEVTYDEGVVLTYTDANGNKTRYTVEDLFGDYLNSSSSASTAYSKVKEVLIRQYFEEDAQAGQLAQLRTEAQNAVDGIKSQALSNAESNGTTYQEEFEALLESNGVDNVDELLEKELYDLEEEAYNTNYYTQANLAQMRDGTLWTDLQTAEAEEEFGPVSDGYLKTEMPYHVSHILVQFDSASSNEHAQATISAAESKKLGDVVKELAGADNSDSQGTQIANNRFTFGSIAYNLSDDTESSSQYGDLGIMDLSTEFVPEFKLGLYAFDALYSNQNDNAYATQEMKDRLLPSEGTELDDGTDVRQAFIDRAIGTIPYGAAVALGDPDVSWINNENGEPDYGTTVNDNSETYYPRNILFNKYFNNHQIAVITPNKIDYNDFLSGNTTSRQQMAEDASASGYYSGTYFAEEVNDDGLPNTKGSYSAEYAALPGFQIDTKGIIDVGGSNVLTNEKGQIVLAVRAGTDSYQGVHFICVDRSALSEFGMSVDENTLSYTTAEEYNAVSASSDVTSLSEYYTMQTPDRVPSNPDSVTEENSYRYYPYYEESDGTVVAKHTFVNKLTSTDSTYAENADKVTEAVRNYDSNVDNYIFQELLSGQGTSSITFNDEDFGNLIKNYIKATRTKSVEDNQKAFDDDWIEYAEYLAQQDAARQMNSNGNQRLISETCAIGYTSDAAADGTGEWGRNGACYDGK